MFTTKPTFLKNLLPSKKKKKEKEKAKEKDTQKTFPKSVTNQSQHEPNMAAARKDDHNANEQKPRSETEAKTAHDSGSRGSQVSGDDTDLKARDGGVGGAGDITKMAVPFSDNLADRGTVPKSVSGPIARLQPADAIGHGHEADRDESNTVIQRQVNQGGTICIQHSPRCRRGKPPEKWGETEDKPVAPQEDDKPSSQPEGPRLVAAFIEPEGGARAEGGAEGGDLDLDLDLDLFPRSALVTPVAALRRGRTRLCHMLNIPQAMIDSPVPPDYTGLAELVGFDAVEIANFWERNPTDSLLRDWARNPEFHPRPFLPAKLGTLVDCLQQMGREDVLMDCQGLLLEDVRNYVAEQQLLKSYTVERLTQFDCYVNIAEADLLTVGRDIVDTLEGVYGLKLCLTLRDVTLGGCQYDKMAEMLEMRCKSKVLIVLTNSYEDSEACQFLTQFAVALDPGSRRNKLIPLLVEEGVVVPRVLRMLAMLRYHRDRRLGFLWPRLVQGIRL